MTTAPRTTVYTLDVDGYAPEILALTRPWLERWVDKIGARLCVIDRRRWPNRPAVYEKLQIHDLARERGDDRIIYIDGDALIHPDMFDPTDHVPMDTVAHNGCDMAGNRWQYDEYFRRDGRHIGSGNWLAIGSSWTLDLWREQDDLTYEEILSRIHPTQHERSLGIGPERLIDDYILSRNIARFGLKFTTIMAITEGWKRPGDYFRHDYDLTQAAKVESLKAALVAWKL